MTTRLVAGIDIGGTNTVIGLVDNFGNLFAVDSISTGDYDDPSEFVVAIVDILNQLSDGNQIYGIGIGAPNGNYYKGTIEFAPNLKWKGVVDLKKMFQKHYSCPIYLTNDANAAAIGEMIFGGARWMKNFVVITLGTGLGSGIVVDGKVLYGQDGFAGELGHTTYDYDGRLCGCGRKGCLETYASASGIKKTYVELAHKNQIPIPEDISAKDIYIRAINNEATALETYNFTALVLGRKLADLVAILSPEAIFIFGGLAKSGDLLLKPLKAYMEENLLEIYKNKVEIRVSSLLDKNAAILGAAALVFGEEKL